MRFADARRSASIISSNSMSESLTEPLGELQIDWSTKTSAPRTFSRISIRHSSFLKRSTSAFPTRVCIRLAIFSASSRLLVPLNRSGCWIMRISGCPPGQTAPRPPEAALAPQSGQVWLRHRLPNSTTTARIRFARSGAVGAGMTRTAGFGVESVPGRSGSYEDTWLDLSSFLRIRWRGINPRRRTPWRRGCCGGIMRKRCSG